MSSLNSSILTKLSRQFLTVHYLPYLKTSMPTLAKYLSLEVTSEHNLGKIAIEYVEDGTAELVTLHLDFDLEDKERSAIFCDFLRYHNLMITLVDALYPNYTLEFIETFLVTNAAYLIDLDIEVRSNITNEELAALAIDGCEIIGFRREQIQSYTHEVATVEEEVIIKSRIDTDIVVGAKERTRRNYPIVLIGNILIPNMGFDVETAEYDRSYDGEIYPPVRTGKVIFNLRAGFVRIDVDNDLDRLEYMVDVIHRNTRERFIVSPFGVSKVK